MGKPPRTGRENQQADAGAPLESILRTEQLRERPQRSPDYEIENRALASLVQALAVVSHRYSPSNSAADSAATGAFHAPPSMSGLPRSTTSLGRPSPAALSQNSVNPGRPPWLTAFRFSRPLG